MKSIRYDPDGELAMFWERDHWLVMRSLDGDAGAWEELYRIAYPIVLRYAARKIKTSADAADIASEAMLRAYRKRQEFQAVSRFSSWVCGFVNYVAMECRRAQLRQAPTIWLEGDELWEEIDYE